MGMLANGYAKKVVNELVDNGETILPVLDETRQAANVPNFVKPAIRYFIKHWRNNGRMATMFKSLKELSEPDLEKFLKERYEFVYEFSKHWKK